MKKKKLQQNVQNIYKMFVSNHLEEHRQQLNKQFDEILTVGV